MLLYFIENSIGKVDDPVDRMLVGEAGEDLYCPIELHLGLFQLVYHHQMLRVIAVSHCVEDVVLPHLALTELNGLFEARKKGSLAQVGSNLRLLLIDQREKIMELIAPHLLLELDFKHAQLLEGEIMMELPVIDFRSVKHDL